MAALIKKRALAEYGHTTVEEGPRPAKTLHLSVGRTIGGKSRSSTDLSSTPGAGDWHPSSLVDVPLPTLLNELLALHHHLPLHASIQQETVDNLISLLHLYCTQSSTEEQRRSSEVIPPSDGEVLALDSSTSTCPISRHDVLRQIVSVIPIVINNCSELSNATTKKCNAQQLAVAAVDALCTSGSIWLQREQNRQQLQSQQMQSTPDGPINARVLSKMVEAAHRLALVSPINSSARHQVIKLSLACLKLHPDHLVKEVCLEAAGSMCGDNVGDIEAGGVNVNVQLVNEVIEVLQHHATYHDNRVRTAAIKAMICCEKGGTRMPPTAYLEACEALDDDYERVREAAIDLLKTIAIMDGDRIVTPATVDEEAERLADHAFFRICGCMNDSSVGVRVKTANALCSIPGVSQNMLMQTLDKKIFSNMRRKLSYHERQAALVSSGEWSSGRGWGQDTAKSQVRVETTNLTHSAGAFVHGLEDECQEVRSATLNALCILAEGSQTFANQCLDFLVDMFNDEIDVVRLNAVQVLQGIVRHIRLQEDQLDEILHALKDGWERIREGVHKLLGSCSFSNTACLQATVNALMESIRKYPQDVPSIQKCMVAIGTKQSAVVAAIVPHLLLIHPYFDAVQPSLMQPQYICKLLLVLNAAAKIPTILPLLEEHTISHYSYLRDTLPQYVPQLKVSDFKLSTTCDVIHNTEDFLYQCLSKLRRLEHSNTQLRLTLYSSVYADLRKLSAVDPVMSAAAEFAALYTRCILILTRLLTSSGWLTQESSASSVQLLVSLTFRLVHAFSGLGAAEAACARGIRLRALALQLVYVVNGSTGSALGLCEAFLNHARPLRENADDNLGDQFLIAALNQLKDEKRPGTVARTLQPLLSAHPPVPLSPIENPSSIHQASATITSLNQDSDTVHKLTAGLLLAVPFIAELSHIPDPSAVRIRIAYPDQSVQHIVPRSNHMEPIDGTNCYRLNTTVLLTAGVWSEACEVQLSLVLDLSPPGLKRKHDPHTIDLSDPRPLMLWPKPMKKAL